MTRVSVLAAVLIISGCASTSQGPHRTEGTGNGGDDRRSYEEKFRPSDYDPDLKAKKTPATVQTTPVATDTVALQPLELVAGFRVQILTTTEIDSAKARKAYAEQAFPEEWFYMEFEAPVYKVRGGNFTNKFDADMFARTLAERGFADAWSVPSRVYKNPPPPPVRQPVPHDSTTVNPGPDPR
jgi:hypothetical protein